MSATSCEKVPNVWENLLEFRKLNEVTLSKSFETLWSRPFFDDALPALRKFHVMCLVCVTRVAFIVVNMVYASLTLRKARMCDDAHTVYCVIEKSVAWVEFAIVGFTILRIFADVILVLNLKRFSFIQINVLADNMKIASSFSLLEFLPVPSKLAYWYQNRERLKLEYVTEPPLLFGHSIFRPCELTQHAMETSGLARPLMVVGLPFIWFCFITIQILVPMALIVFPLMSIPAFLIKMSGLPSTVGVGNWTGSEWITLLGVLNQTSKLWDVGQIEKVAVFRFASRITNPHCKYDPRTHLELSAEVSKALLLQMDPVRASVMLIAMDAQAWAETLSGQYQQKVY